tara:strand:- start:825 stop:1226 length:402 start_codon:yes stop_codon:yes gene_type:complete
MDKAQIETCLLALESYLEEFYNIDVIYENGIENAYYPEDDMIIISTKQTKEMRLYSLLHEVGHVVSRPDNVVVQEVNKKRFTWDEKVGILKEEYRAWDEGKKLAAEMCLGIDRERYDKLATKCLKDYILWASK